MNATSVAETSCRDLVPVHTPAKKHRNPASFTPGDASTVAGSPLASSSGEPADSGGKPCPGCGRLYLISLCFYLADQLARWALPLGRGLWCADCHAVWRSCHSGTLSLTYFPQWLAVPGNFALWNLQLAAFCALKLEGATSIHAQHIASRVQQYTCMSKFLATPLQHTAIATLQDVHNPASKLHGLVVTPSTLVTLLAPDGTSRAAAFVQPPFELPKVMQLKDLQDRPVHYRSIGIADEEDANLVRAACGEGALCVVESKASQAITLYEGSAGFTSRLEGKLWVLSTAVKALLGGCCSSGWETNVKESHFTEPVKKLVGRNRRLCPKAMWALRIKSRRFSQ